MATSALSEELRSPGRQTLSLTRDTAHPQESEAASGIRQLQESETGI